MKEEIIVVGSGVIGLTCALELCQLNKYKVSIVSDHIPIPNQASTETGRKPALLDPLYTSSWAGAHFRPFPSSNETELRDSKLTRVTYKEFKKISQQFPESSIKFMTGIDFIEGDNSKYSSLHAGYTEGIEDFKVLSKKELPEGFSFGAKYKTWCLNPPVYLQFLQRRLEMDYGVEFHYMKLNSLRELRITFPNSSKIINCTGMGLQYMPNSNEEAAYDPSCFPIRGQTLLIQPPLSNSRAYQEETITYQLKDGSWSFVIPRPLSGGVIVGGTKKPGISSITVDDDELAKLISNGKKFFPGLLGENRELKIKNINVGLRPARKGGVCLDTKVYDGVEVFNCYGFGGSGFEMSFGAAKIISEKVEACHVTICKCKL